MVTNNLRISVAYKNKASCLTYMACPSQTGCSSQLCSYHFHSESQADETAPTWDKARFTAEGKEKVADHIMALQVLAQKWHVSLLNFHRTKQVTWSSLASVGQDLTHDKGKVRVSLPQEGCDVVINKKYILVSIRGSWLVAPKTLIII